MPRIFNLKDRLLKCGFLRKPAFLGFGVIKQDLVGLGEIGEGRVGVTELHRNCSPFVMFKSNAVNFMLN